MCIIMHTNTVRFNIKTTAEYDNWFKILSNKNKAEVEKRLLKICIEGHFGKEPNKYKRLGGGLEELKFHDQSAMRIYLAKTGVNEITLLLGGFKNGQQKDIKKARSHLS